VNVGEPQVRQRHRLAGSAEQSSVHSPAHRPEPQRVARHEHSTHRVEEGHVIRAVKAPAHRTHHHRQVGDLIAAEPIGQRVHDYLGVGVEREMVIASLQQPVAKLGEVGQVAVEGEAEPLPPPAVMALERLGVTHVVCAARGVASVPDGCRTGVIGEDGTVLGRVRHPKRLADGTRILMSIEKLRPVGVVAAQSGRKLAAILKVQQHRRHQG